MAALDFPDTSTLDVGYVHTQNDKSWTWNGTAWEGTTAEAPELLFSIGQFNNNTAAEAAMVEDGFYTWCRTLDGNPACSMLTYKKGNVIFHVSELSHGETFIVGDQPDDHFTSVKTAIQYVQYLKIQDRGIINIVIRPGEYEFDSALDLSHDNGDNIFIRPIDSSPGVTYPSSTDFTGVSADDLDMLKSKYPVKFKFTNPTDQINGIVVTFGTARIEDILCYKETESETRGISITFGGKVFVTGCSFFGFAGGILGNTDAYARVFDCNFSHMVQYGPTADNNGYGIKMGTNSNLVGRGNIIYSCPGNALVINSGSHGQWLESVIEECGKSVTNPSDRNEAIGVNDHSTLLCPRAGTLSGNIIKNCHSGIFISQSSVARIGDLTCIDSDRWNIRSYSDSNIYIFDPVSLSGSGVGFEDIEVEDGGTVSFTSDVNNILGSTIYNSPLKVINTDGAIIKDNSQPIQSIENWDSTYTTVSANSASWGDTGSVSAPTGNSTLSGGTAEIVGGLVLKYGEDVSTSSSAETFQFDTPFPNNCFSVFTDGASAHLPTSNITVSGFTIDRDDDITLNRGFRLFAIGN